MKGIGLHTGQPVHLRCCPAPPDSGIVFRRIDQPGRPELALSWDRISGNMRGTNLTVGDVTVHTVEHLLACCHGLMVDNLLIELDGPEPPATDGSARPFVEAFLEAGRESQSAPRTYLEVREPVTVRDSRGALTVVPADECRISYTLQYDNPLIGCQYLEVVLTEESFLSELMSARTFCLKEEVDGLQGKDLGLGGSLENALVVDGDSLLNEGPLRYPDEFVRHKMLDLVGDLFTLGRRPLGHFLAYRSGHDHNVRLLCELNRRSAIGLREPDRGDGMHDISKIWEVLPHRYPFLLVDRIIEFEEGKSAVGLKNVSINEPFFQGHFPGQAVMPGVLIIEALAQVAGYCLLVTSEHKGKTPYFTGLDSVRFRRTIVPGDQVRLETHVEKIRGNMGRVKGRALVKDQLAAEGLLKFTVR